MREGKSRGEQLSELTADARKFRNLRSLLDIIGVAADLADEAVGINSFLAQDPKLLSTDKKIVYAILQGLKELGRV